MELCSERWSQTSCASFWMSRTSIWCFKRTRLFGNCVCRSFEQMTSNTVASSCGCPSLVSLPFDCTRSFVRGAQKKNYTNKHFEKWAIPPMGQLGILVGFNVYSFFFLAQCAYTATMWLPHSACDSDRCTLSASLVITLIKLKFLLAVWGLGRAGVVGMGICRIYYRDQSC